GAALAAGATVGAGVGADVATPGPLPDPLPVPEPVPLPPAPPPAPPPDDPPPAAVDDAARPGAAGAALLSTVRAGVGSDEGGAAGREGHPGNPGPGRRAGGVRSLGTAQRGDRMRVRRQQRWGELIGGDHETRSRGYAPAVESGLRIRNGAVEVRGWARQKWRAQRTRIATTTFSPRLR